MKLYNVSGQSSYAKTAGKITIATAFTGLLVFVFAFMFKAGTTELLRVEAQSGTATTSLLVLNTPPQWTIEAEEEFESSTSSPTNSGSEISWLATATDSSSQPYFLLICSTPTLPNPNAASTSTNLGTAPPNCTDGVQWAVSTATVSGTEARAATTTTEIAPFDPEELPWYAWVCDDDADLPRCNQLSTQGTTTTASPFIVNFRPTFTSATSTSPVDPGATLNFTTVSTDGNVVRPKDNIFLYACPQNDFNPVTRDCTDQYTSSTASVTDNASAAFQLAAVVPDGLYDAYVYIVDQFNHPALGGAQGTNITFTVNNVAPTVASSSINLNTGELVITEDGGETTGFSLVFQASDANSCFNDEIVGYDARIYRSGAACNGTPGSYDPNSCYPSSVGTSTWNLSCTIDDTSCNSINDTTVTFNCTFPLWFVADPTDAGSFFAAEDWVAEIAAIDNNNATSSLVLGDSPATLISFPYFQLLTAEIPYGQLEPGEESTTNASTTIEARGNTGIDQLLSGADMCGGYAPSSPCTPNPAGTIPAAQQEYSTTSAFTHGSGSQLSSSTDEFFPLSVPKSTSTTTPANRDLFWNIEVPLAITVAGSYTGLNSFIQVMSSSSRWY